MTQADAYGKPTEEQFGYALSGQNTYARSTGQMLSQKWQPFDEPTFIGNIESIDYGYDVLGNACIAGAQMAALRAQQWLMTTY